MYILTIGLWLPLSRLLHGAKWDIILGDPVEPELPIRSARQIPGKRYKERQLRLTHSRDPLNINQMPIAGKHASEITTKSQGK